MFRTFSIGLVTILLGIIGVHSGVPAARPTVRQLDACMTCLNQVAASLDYLSAVIINPKNTRSCDTLCPAVALKSRSDVTGAFCDLTCQAIGIEAFVKTVRTADLNPIRYCQVARACPVKDDGDAKITSFAIVPASGPKGTTFAIDFSYVSLNGTGPGEVQVSVMTQDRVPYSITFIVEGKSPGTNYQAISFTADTDPTCDPTIQPCEQWLPGTYNLTVQLCNGKCGSKFPHSQVYDTGRGSFKVLG